MSRIDAALRMHLIRRRFVSEGLAVLCVAFLTVVCALGWPPPAMANSDVQFAGGAATKCTLKGIVKAELTAPPATGAVAALSDPRKVSGGILQTDALAKLKQQARALGANRLYVRDINSEGVIAFGARGAGASWEGSLLVAEAYRC